MRIDHIAYQRATRVAALGFFVQAAVGVLLLLFSMMTGEAGDTTFRFGALFVLCGLIPWLSLIVVFHQHKLERLEALEEDELSGRESAGSIFDAADEEIRVAARRLRLMHKWLMPIACLVLVAALSLFAWIMLSFLSVLNATGEDVVLDAGEFAMTQSKGWAVAICLSIAAVSFIFSRFVAGMAKHAAWQNLRGGAGYMVGNAVVLAAIATGVIFRFFNNDQAMTVVAYIIPIVMLLMAAETCLNLVLNFYRPRIPGEVPRPAFDSRVLSILAAPDSLVRSINEAVNYQFGFDLTSTWGYKLLMRSVLRLAGIGIAVLLLLSCVVVIEPGQQGVKLAGGKILGDEVHTGLMLKLPWPLQTAQVHHVADIKSLPLTAVRIAHHPLDPRPEVYVWSARDEDKTDREVEPFLVGRSRLDPSLQGSQTPLDGEISGSHSLLDAEIILQYRVSDLIQFLAFAPDTYGRRERLTMREKAMRAIALREVSQHLSAIPLDSILSRQRSQLGAALQARIQQVFDDRKTGVEVTAVVIPKVRPSGDAARNFEDLMIARQNQQVMVEKAERLHEVAMTFLIGDPGITDEVLAEITRFNEMLRESETRLADPAVIQQRQHVEAMLVEAGGDFGQMIRAAETDRWITILSDRAQESRVRGQLPLYMAAPDLYTQREIMRVYGAALATKRKILVGVDASRVNVDVELKEINSQFLIAGQTAVEGDTQ